MQMSQEIFEEEDSSDYSDVNSEADSEAAAEEDSSWNPDEIEPGDRVRSRLGSTMSPLRLLPQSPLRSSHRSSRSCPLPQRSLATSAFLSGGLNAHGGRDL